MKLSVFVITLNEESNIERCLESVRWADEIVVVDSGSTDRTCKIARQYTDRVFTRSFDGFSTQKAAALAHTSHEWVLNLDADETLSEDLSSQIREVLAAPGDVFGYLTPRLTYYLGRPIRHCGWYPDHQLRLGSRERASYGSRRVHERMEVDGAIGRLPGHIEHYGFRSLEEHLLKMTLYSQEMALQMQEEGRPFRLSDLLIRPAAAFAGKYVLQQGFRDGLRGLLVSSMHSYYVFLKYAWLWDLKRVRKPLD